MSNFSHAESLGVYPVGNPENAMLSYLNQLGQVVLYPSGHPDRSSSLNNLVNAVQTRIEQLGQMEDLEESIQLRCDVMSTWSSRSLDVP